LKAEARRVGAAKTLVAHTRDDLLETALMRVFRGSGPAGLAAMPRETSSVLRPLLGIGRADALAYLSERGIPYRTDSTNADPAFLRNRIRLKLIPCLDEFFPSWRQALAGLAETQRLVADFLADESAARIPWEEEAGAEPRRLTGRNNFFSQPQILREEALFTALDRLAGKKGADLKPPRRSSLRVFAQGKAGSLDLGRAALKTDAGRIVLQAPRRGEGGFSLLIKEPGIYKLKWLCVRALPGKAGERSPSAKGRGFFACPPVALRGQYPGDFVIRNGRKRRGAEMGKVGELITVEDALGPVAFINRGRDGSVAVLAGENENREQQETCLFFVV
jgi:tRNA(Ile)-lysidine synthase